MLRESRKDCGLNGREKRINAFRGCVNRRNRVHKCLHLAGPLGQCNQHPLDMGRRQSVRVVHQREHDGFHLALLDFSAVHFGNELQFWQAIFSALRSNLPHLESYFETRYNNSTQLLDTFAMSPTFIVPRKGEVSRQQVI